VVAGDSPAGFRTLNRTGRENRRGLFCFYDSAESLSGRILTLMDKKEIESPKLTANFLIWISAFVLLLFLLIAHFVWRIF
jgi:hypothetical protein